MAIAVAQQLPPPIPQHMTEDLSASRYAEHCRSRTVLAGTLKYDNCSRHAANRDSGTSPSGRAPRTPPAPHPAPRVACRSPRYPPRREPAAGHPRPHRVDVLAAMDDQFLNAASDGQIAELVPAGQVTREIPPVLQAWPWPLACCSSPACGSGPLTHSSPSSPMATSAPDLGSTSRTVSPGTGRPPSPAPAVPVGQFMETGPRSFP